MRDNHQLNHSHNLDNHSALDHSTNYHQNKHVHSFQSDKHQCDVAATHCVGVGGQTQRDLPAFLKSFQGNKHKAAAPQSAFVRSADLIM